MFRMYSHDPVLSVRQCVLILLGPALSFAGLCSFIGFLELPLTMITVDVTFQVLNVLLLCGMLGTIPLSLEALQRLAVLSGFHLDLASQRIAFEGHIANEAADCIVSFPSKCHQIYGPMLPIAYLSTVDLRAQDGQSRQEALAFKKADAEAMGQRLLVRLDQGDVEWEREVAEALQEAEECCAKNQALAPWGCQRFETCSINIDKEAERKQMLHVFYFEATKGKGKMHWELLRDEDALQAAQKDSGLGASQTAGVVPG